MATEMKKTEGVELTVTAHHHYHTSTTTTYTTTNEPPFAYYPSVPHAKPCNNQKWRCAVRCGADRGCHGLAEGAMAEIQAGELWEKVGQLLHHPRMFQA